MRGRIAAVVTAAVLMSGAGNAAAAIDADKPYVYMSPLYTPKDATNATVVFASGDTASQVVRLRRYNAVGGLLGSQNVTLGAKSSIIAFAGANSGAQMHVEIWADSPAVQVELTYTHDDTNAVITIPSGDWRVIGPGDRTVPGQLGEIVTAVTALKAPIDTLSTKVDAVQAAVDGVKTVSDAIKTGADAIKSGVDALGPKIDAIQPGATGSDAGAIAVLASDNAKLRKSVTKLTKQLRSLRKLIVRRLPKKK